MELTVTLEGGATFATAQTIDLTFASGEPIAGVDFTVTDARGQALTAPLCAHPSRGLQLGGGHDQHR